MRKESLYVTVVKIYNKKCVYTTKQVRLGKSGISSQDGEVLSK